MEKRELTSLINKCFEAVNESQLGHVITKKDDGSYIINNIPYEAFRQVLTHVLTSELPITYLTKQSGSLDMKLDDPGDLWKKGL